MSNNDTVLPGEVRTGSRRGRIAILLAISMAAIGALLWVGPIPQDPGYHGFADGRTFRGVPNFWNVASNLPFLLAGGLGLQRYPRLLHAETGEGYLVLCVGVLLVGFGSAYYHWSPSNETLLWDRLPMTVAFMALTSLLLTERVTATHRRSQLWLLVAAGVASALYWAWTESAGRGDLRPYVLVQFLPVLLAPLILMLFRRRYLHTGLLLASFLAYGAAKVLEHFDAQVFVATGVMGGHALKHVAAALAVLCIIRAVPAGLRRH